MDYLWKINGTPLTDLGIEIAAGNLRTHGVSSLTLRRVVDFDAGEILAYGAAAVLSYNAGGGDIVFFRGKVASIPKYGSGEEEGHDIVIEDAWADFEKTIYQEAWNSSGGTVNVPRAVFGMNSAGSLITVGAQAALVASACFPSDDVAVSVSVTGEYPALSEIVNQTGDEILMECLRLHPDWIPWIDHGTSPKSTFKITPLSSAAPITYSVAGTDIVSKFDIMRRDDLLPASVRIIYESADKVDEAVFRKLYEDLWPALGATSGPRVLQAYIPLQGVQVQTQKQRTYCETIPTDAGDAATKTWLKKKYPQLAAIPDSHFDVESITSTLVADPADIDNEPINPSAERISVSDASDLPRELVKGSIEDWMRLSVGTVKVVAEISTNGSTTPEESALISGTLTPLMITATDAPAGAKLHKGVSSWQAAEDVPSGIAQSVYQAIHSAIPHQGSVSVIAREIPTSQIIGGKLRLTGGVAGWATMDAPINALDWDITTGTATISFGPPEYLAPQDFLEMQRILRRRDTRWFQTDERASDEIGSSSGASASGDTVTPFDFPISAPGLLIPTGGGTFDHPFKITTSVVEEVPKYTLAKGSITDGTNGSAIDLTGLIETATTATAGHVCIVGTVDASLAITGWALEIATAGDAAKEVEFTTTGTIRQNKIRLHIGKLTVADGIATAWQATFDSQRITHGEMNGLTVKVFEPAPTHPAKV